MEVKSQAKNIDEYIAAFPGHVQGVLQQVRLAIRKAAPGAEECISYSIPTFKLNGNLVHFAAFKNHVGFYPAPSGIRAFQKDLSRFEGAKGSVKFPIDQPMPLALISKITRFRVKENLEKSTGKPKKK